ncbi:unnamed protein product, partial [Symbiodinium sp. CCMP2456]
DEAEAASSTGLHPTIDIFDVDPEEYDQHRPLQQPYECKEEEQTDSYVAGESLSLLSSPMQREADREYGEHLQDLRDLQAGDLEVKSEAKEEPIGDDPLHALPTEPDGPPPSLTERQRRRLQQLFEDGDITRLSASETDAMVWRRYRTQQKQNYRSHRRDKRRAGDWQPDRRRAGEDRREQNEDY